jgi:hypothetical protein
VLLITATADKLLIFVAIDTNPELMIAVAVRAVVADPQIGVSNIRER